MSLRYRSPEVVLQAGWSYEADIWAIGCTIAELATGWKLFPDQTNENVHLLLMEKCVGKRLPPEMLQRAWQKGVTRSNQLLVPSNQGKILVNPKISDILQQKKFNEGRLLSDMVSDSNLLDLLIKLLEFDPTRRPKAAPLRRHSFFENSRFDRSEVDVKTAYLPLPSVALEASEQSAPSGLQTGPSVHIHLEREEPGSTVGVEAQSDFDIHHATAAEMEQELQKNLHQQSEKLEQLDLERDELRALQRQLSTQARKERDRQEHQSSQSDDHVGQAEKRCPSAYGPARTQSADQLEALLHELQGNLAFPMIVMWFWCLPA